MMVVQVLGDNRRLSASIIARDSGGCNCEFEGRSQVVDAKRRCAYNRLLCVAREVEVSARFEQVEAQPWSDGKRVKVSFLWEGEGPVDVEIALLSSSGELWAQMTVVELSEHRMDVTLHVRAPNLTEREGVAHLRLTQAGDEFDARSMPFTLPSPSPIP